MDQTGITHIMVNAEDHVCVAVSSPPQVGVSLGLGLGVYVGIGVDAGIGVGVGVGVLVVGVGVLVGYRVDAGWRCN